MTQVRKASSKHNRRGEVWDDAYERIHREHPSTVRVQASALPIEGLIRLVGDLDNFLVTNGRTGHRTPPTPEQISGTVSTIFRDGLGVGAGPRLEREYTSLPFHEALKIMIGERSAVQMSRRTGIQLDRMKRLMGIRDGKAYAPTGDEMAAIASTFGKEPWYFREVRSAMIAAMVLLQMDENPDQSARLVRELAS